MVLIRWLFRELRNQKSFTIFFVLNLMAGITAMVGLGAIQASLTDAMSSNARVLLGADVAVSVRRKFSDVELKSMLALLPADAHVSRAWEFFSMIEAGGRSQLVRVEAFDAAAPLVGEFRLKPSPSDRLGDAEAWASPEFLSAFESSVGSSLAMDRIPFTVRAEVLEDPRHSIDFASFAPRLYIALEPLIAKKWIGSTATLTDNFRVALRDPTTALELRRKLEMEMRDPGIRVRTAAAAARDSVRAYQYLGDYLGLVSLAGFLLAAIGCGFLVQQFLQSRRLEMAVLNVFGLQKGEAMRVYFLQVLALAFFAACGGLVLAILAGPALIRVIQPFSPVEVHFRMSFWDVARAFGLTLLAACSVGGPLVLRLRGLETKSLLSDDACAETETVWTWRDRAWFLPGLFAFYALCVGLSHSWKVGSVFFASVVVAVLVLVLLNSFLVERLGFFHASGAASSLAFWQITRKPFSALVLISTLTFALVMIDLIPQVQSSLQADLTIENVEDRPSLFMFDIQEEQKEELRSYLAEKNLSMKNLSPMVRARLLKVNDAAFERADEAKATTREEEDDMRFRNRGVNLSYRADLHEGEEIVSGIPLPSTHDEASAPAAVSVETGYAKRLGLKLHDKLVFDVQGVEIPGVVVNLRKVHWSSFEPNFFMIVQPGVLEEAPKTWIANLPPLDRKATMNLQSEIVKKFSNISLVDIHRAVDEIVKLTSQISGALLYLATFVFGCGVVVLVSVSRQQYRTRMRDFALLKMLGAIENMIVRSALLESAMVASLAVIEALMISALTAWCLLHFVFDDAFHWNFRWALVVAGGAVLSVVLIQILFSLGLRRARAQDLWREFR